MNAQLTAFAVTYKQHATARKLYTWVRFADSVEAATESALNALDTEFYGEAVLVSMEVTADPRI